MVTRLDAYKNRQKLRYGKERCDFSELDSADPSVIMAFEDGFRMVFDYSMDGEKPVRGYVGVTTGWKPAFIVVNNARSSGGDVIPKGAKAIAVSGDGRRRIYA